MIRHSAWAVLAAIAVACAPAAEEESAASHMHEYQGEIVGQVEFATSCAPEVQADFERGVAMLHSFWFGEAYEVFQQVAGADPECGMAHWGIAMTLMGNPLVGQDPSGQNMAAGTAAAERAVALTATATDRERGFAEAALAFYRDHERTHHRERMLAHEEAMRRLYEAFPDDPETILFYGRAIVANAPPDDLTFQRKWAAAELMEPLFAGLADHPGLAHYVIHAFDAPPMAEHGLDAALRYAEIAPSAPHALHMPTHIFTRLGYWDESIELNRRSAEAEPVPEAAVHPMDYMVYAYLQQGRDEAARVVVDRAVDLPDRFYGGTLGYNFAAMPARFALERGRWAEAAQLPLPADNAAPYVAAITRFARAVGAARSEQPAQARTEVEALAELVSTLEAAGNAYWATVVGAQRLAAAAWLARAEGDDEEALRLAAAGADLEETVEKHPVTPGPLLPARELQGDLLMELGRPAEAREAYEKTLEREPRRARTLYGAARAAELAGDAAAARAYFAELAELMDRADPDRPEAEAARAFLASS